MNWDTVKGDWMQYSGKVKAQWGKLTDDELTQINGNREQLEGKIQARYVGSHALGHECGRVDSQPELRCGGTSDAIHQK